MTKETKVSHRNHLFRTLIQKPLEKHTGDILTGLDRIGLLNNTKIADVLDTSDPLLPDHVTLTGLQMTVEAAKSLASSGLKGKNLERGILGWVLDAFDGNLARELGMSSPEGAVKDVLADRIGEIYIARLVAEQRGRFNGSPHDLERNLAISFQLSTLTKAACEMCAVHTSEGGRGSMLERRRILLMNLADLGSLNKGVSIPRQRRLLDRIDNNNRLLIDGSFNRARKRSRAIAHMESYNTSGWNNPILNDDNSPAAIEARKYATVFRMNEILGFPIENTLNTLADGVKFPSAKFLRELYPYVDDCIRKTDEFFNQALSIADLSKQSV